MHNYSYVRTYSNFRNRVLYVSISSILFFNLPTVEKQSKAIFTSNLIPKQLVGRAWEWDYFTY